MIEIIKMKNCKDIKIEFLNNKFVLKSDSIKLEFVPIEWKDFQHKIINAPHMCFIDNEKICDGCNTCNELNEDYINDIMSTF